MVVHNNIHRPRSRFYMYVSGQTLIPRSEDIVECNASPAWRHGERKDGGKKKAVSLPSESNERSNSPEWLPGSESDERSTSPEWPPGESRGESKKKAGRSKKKKLKRYNSKGKVYHSKKLVKIQKDDHVLPKKLKKI